MIKTADTVITKSY